jgi:hypothetical protein
MRKSAPKQATEIQDIVESLDVIGNNPLNFVTDSEPVQIATINHLKYPLLLLVGNPMSKPRSELTQKTYTF